MNEDFANTGSGVPVEDRRTQQFWGDRYIDDAIMYRSKARGSGQSDVDFAAAGYDTPKYQLTDAQFSVVAVLAEGVYWPYVCERVEYTPYGVAAAVTEHAEGEFNGDDVLDPDDLADFMGAYFSIPPAASADWTRDGTVDPDDLADYIAAYFAGQATPPEAGAISAHGNVMGYCGYVFNPATVGMGGGGGMYTVRFRH